MKHIYFALGGVIFFTAALLPLPYLVRSSIALFFGLIPLGADLGMQGDWQNYTMTSALVVLPAALFLRWKYRGSLLARVLVGLGVVAILCTAFVPIHGELPILRTFNGIDDASASVVFATIYPNILILLVLLALLAFLGQGSTGLVQIWAVCLLFYLPFSKWMPLLDSTVNANILEQLPVIYAGFFFLIYLSLSSLGLFQLLSPLSRPRTIKN